VLEDAEFSLDAVMFGI